MRNRYQIPLQVTADGQVVRYPLMQLMSFGAARDGRSTGTVSIILEDFICPDNTDESNSLVPFSLIPEMPMLRIAFGGVLQVVSLRAKVGGAAEERAPIVTDMGFNGQANPMLELFLDTSTLSTRPVRVAWLGSADADWTKTTNFGSYRNVGDMLWLYPNTSTIFVVEGSWLDQIFSAIATPPQSYDAASGQPSLTMRFSFGLPPLLQVEPGTAAGAGGVVPTLPIGFSRFPSSSALSQQIIDVALMIQNPEPYSAPVGDPTQRQYFSINGYPVQYTAPSWQDVAITNPLAPWVMMLGSAYQTDATTPVPGASLTMHLGWCPDIKRGRSVANLLFTIGLD